LRGTLVDVIDDADHLAAAIHALLSTTATAVRSPRAAAVESAPAPRTPLAG
jgi:hypothetical protein